MKFRQLNVWVNVIRGIFVTQILTVHKKNHNSDHLTPAQECQSVASTGPVPSVPVETSLSGSGLLPAVPLRTLLEAAC